MNEDLSFKEICLKFYEAINTKRPNAVENVIISKYKLEIIVHEGRRLYIPIKENDNINEKINQLINQYWADFD